MYGKFAILFGNSCHDVFAITSFSTPEAFVASGRGVRNFVPEEGSNIFKLDVNSYIVKPVEFDGFMDALSELG
jgi:hypothetical protein